MVNQFYGLNLRIFNPNHRSKNSVLRNTILVSDMPIISTKDLVKQFLLAGQSNQGAVIWIYFRQLNARIDEREKGFIPLEG